MRAGQCIIAGMHHKTAAIVHVNSIQVGVETQFFSTHHLCDAVSCGVCDTVVLSHYSSDSQQPLSAVDRELTADLQESQGEGQVV